MDKQVHSLKPVYYNITVPISGQEADEVVINGEEYSWSFATTEDPNVHIRDKLVDESTFHAEDEEDE